MQTLTEYKRGFRAGTRASVERIHEQARQMNDPRARDILNTAAFHLGQEAARERELGWFYAPIGWRWRRWVKENLSAKH